VIERRAEVAPIDSYALALLSKHAPELTSQVRIVMSTEATPIPLLVASGAASPGITAAFLKASEMPAAAALMDQLLVHRFVRPEAKAYDELRESFLTMRAFWRGHPLAEKAHPLFAF
jgi:ABC-type phosphate/phosphonate transport system substrate-binding protein